MGIKKEIPFGSKYGKLEVIAEEPHTYHPNGKMKRLVKVTCECGETVVKAWSDVKSGQQKSCGLCPKDQPVKDISGLKVYRLTVLDFYRKENNKVFWKCICDCGNDVFIDGIKLRNATIRNCGECGSKLGSYYLGDKVRNNEGYTGTITGIKDKIISLTFDGFPEIPIQTHYTNIKTGSFCNPFHKSVCGVGYYGIGDFIAKNGDRHTEEYENWSSMLKRCYASTKHQPAYADKYVCELWHCFQDFAKWATTQQGFDREGWHLDKDLIVKGNTVYSPDTCVYIPQEINSFIKRKRFNDLPLGVDISHKYNGTPYFRVQARENGKNLILGAFDNVEEAFLAYKTHKERLAKEMAEKWKFEIDQRAYFALLNYTVEITD